MIATFDHHIIELTQNTTAMGIIERVDNELKRIYFEEGREEGREEGFGEGVAKGKLEGQLEGTKAGIMLGKIQSLAALRGTSYFSGSSNEDLATTFQLPLAWVERIRKGDLPAKEEVEKLVAGQNGNGH